MPEPAEYLGKIVEVVIDRPLGSHPPEFRFYYPVNYGYIPGTRSGDGEELDAYILAVDEPRDAFSGRCIALVVREDEDDPKLVVVPDGVSLEDDAIVAATWFQEQHHRSRLVRHAACQETKRAPQGRSNPR